MTCWIVIYIYSISISIYLFIHLLTLNFPDKGKNVPALKNAEVICTVPCRSLLSPSYYHSFGMTDNYFIFIEQPFKLDILRMATAYMRGVNWASCLKFCPEENVRKRVLSLSSCLYSLIDNLCVCVFYQTLIHLIERKTGKVVDTKYYTGSLVVYHHVNAFEVDGHVIFDVIAYNDCSLYDMFYINNMKEEMASHDKPYSKPSYRRYVLPIHPDKVGEV